MIKTLPASALLARCLCGQDLAERVAAARSPLSLTEDGLSGDGAEWLLEQAEAARFFLIGESHGNRETCALTDWLLGRCKPLGYDVYATETGPCATAHVVGLADAVVRRDPRLFVDWFEADIEFEHGRGRGLLESGGVSEEEYVMRSVVCVRSIALRQFGMNYLGATFDREYRGVPSVLVRR